MSDYTELPDYSEEMDLSNAELMLDGNRGIYIPKQFIEIYGVNDWVNIDQEQRDILTAGPDHELYWDVWWEVLDNAYIIQDSKKWTLWQDGDLWLIPETI